MKIEEVSLDVLKPYQKNPRKNGNAINSIAESIKQFGFKQPIVIDKDNVIVVGHARYEAAKKLGMTTVPCVRADELTKEQVKAYRILDNKLNELSTWDFETLSEELKSFEFDFEEFKVELPEFNFQFEGSDTESTPDKKKKELSSAIRDLRDKAAYVETELAIYVKCRSEEEQEDLFNYLVEKGYDAKCVRT